MPPPVFRFAPSPNGYLHLGHAFSALLNFDRARALGGRVLLRMEDIDPTRCRPEFETAIFEDLAWLGIAWEEPVLRQSDSMPRYQAALQRLQAEGLVYPAFESRTENARLVAAREADGTPWPRDPDGVPLYPGHAGDMPSAECTRRIAAGEPYALRLDMAAALKRAGPLAFVEGGDREGDATAVAATPAVWGDVVLGRKETPTSYHLSVVVDDAFQGVTRIVRGQDLAPATHVHRLLQALLGLPTPAYRHHRLILDDRGNKLAKSNGATALRTLREQGATPADIRRLGGLV
jgi:glutamyl-Q tRNA(Asp) synthetase